MKTSTPKGFSLVELMIAASIISLLGMLATPGIRAAADRTEAAATANDLRIFMQSIEFYSNVSGAYPSDMERLDMPEEIVSYLPAAWTEGVYLWDYINTEAFIFTEFPNLDLSTEQIILIDSMLDDGNPASGVMRLFEGRLRYYFRIAA